MNNKTEKPITKENNKNRDYNVYIAMPMTGKEDYNYEEFQKIAKVLKKHKLHPVHTANTPRNGKWSDYIKDSLNIIDKCDAVLLQEDWRKSAGCIIEQTYATEIKLPVYYLDGLSIDGVVEKMIGDLGWT